MIATVTSIRQQFAAQWSRLRLETPQPDMVEILGTSFLADEPAIMSAPNLAYIERELSWYRSQSLSVHDLIPPVPKIWQEVSGFGGGVNSNYGYLVFSRENGHQFANVVAELQRNRASRRAIAIYTRPSMHTDATANGMNDFVCTNAVNYFIREGELSAIVQMRSNDAVFGFPNDFAWQQFVQERIASAVAADVGPMIWQAASLHVYPRHYSYLDELIRA